MSPAPLINCITTTGITSTDHTCKICLETIFPNLSSTQHIPCGNVFCSTCLTSWVTSRLTSAKSPTCPTCRANLVADANVPCSQTDEPIPTETRAFETHWRTVAANAQCVAHLNGLLDLIDADTMDAHPQPDPIPRVSDSTLTHLFTTGLMDNRTRPIQLHAVAAYGVREWGMFFFPARDRTEPRIAEEQRRYFFVPMVPGQERNGGFLYWGYASRKETRFGRWMGRLFGKKKTEE